MQWRQVIQASGRGRFRPAAILWMALVVVAAACGSPGEPPPVAALGPPATSAGPTSVEDAPARPDEVGGGGLVSTGPGVGGPDICDLARDGEAMADVERWAGYIPALEAALPPEVDVAAALGGLTPETPATPTVVTGLDLVWDLVDERCQQDPLIEQCRNLIAIALADPIGWAVRAPDAVEVEAAFRLASANWDDLRQRVVGDDLRRSVDANLELLDRAGEALAAVGWEPGRLDVLEPLADELVALGEPSVVGPLAQLEADCGFG